MDSKRSLFLVALLSVAFAAASTPDDDAVALRWIQDHAIQLKTVEAGHGFDDMEPLQKVIGDARIVELGEATHGSREFFQLKHRMLEFLATRMGFSVFAIEANMPEAYRLNDYVLNGTGDPAKLLEGMYFWTWDTQEVLDMIQWMREFNRSGKGHVQFTGFDMQTPDVAMEMVRDFIARNDPSYAPNLEAARTLAGKVSQGDGQRFGVATARFPIQAAAGKNVRFRGYIKTQTVTRNWAGLWWRVDGKSGVLAFDNMNSRGVTGTTDWKQYEISLKVPSDATNINFGAILSGDGTAWFDDLTVDLDGVPYDGEKTLDLGFESAPPSGFYTGGIGYDVQVDTQVYNGGHQSLRISFLPKAGESVADAGAAAASWKNVVQHLQDSQSTYRGKGLSTADTDWAIQNARVVLQSLEMKSGEVSRDQSMADNIKWIADHNPGAKIVVWAHNGHVAYGGWPGYQPMGAALRKMFGNRVVNFGFAFNQGSFQAVEPGKSLREFTVGPAPAGSLDATLAATGIPVFALDLRSGPKNGPVTTWLHAPHQTRSIGSIYSEDRAQQFWESMDVTECYDAMFFVERTTVARRNP